MALLCAVVFAAVVIARLPAEWVIPVNRGPASCTGVEGSVWNGSCAGLAWGATPIGDVSWSVRPLRLLIGRLAAHVNLTRDSAHASADVEIGFGGRLTAHGLVGDLPLDAALLPGFPQNLYGHAHLELALAQVEHGVITQLEGRIEARDLEDRGQGNTALGSYLVTFPGGPGEPSGKLRDLEGPLALEGTLRLTRQPGFELQGFIAPRRGAPPALVNDIRLFGAPDAAGRRPFSIAGTF